MTKRTVRIAFSGGGTGGHVYPLIAVLESLKEEAQAAEIDLEFHYFGANDLYSEKILSYGVKFHPLFAAKLRRYFSPLTLIDIPKFIISMFQALTKMFMVMPDILFSKGGPGALPVVWAAWWYRIPVVIHESDAKPGLTTLLSARFARRIGLSFESTVPYFNPKKRFLAGNPVRASLLRNKMEKVRAKEMLGFLGNAPLILFLGGSQGSKRLNEFVEVNLKDLLGIAQIFHQAGRANFEEAQKLSRAALLDIPVALEAHTRYKVVSYTEDSQLAAALSAADLVVARAGSGSVFEVAAFGKPSLLIPFPDAARDHQRANAYEYAKSGATIVIEEANLTEQIVVHEIRRILTDSDVRAKMEESALRFAKPDAANLIASEILSLVKR